MPYITTADHTDIHYHDWGTGTPVVLIHGWPLCSDMWEHQTQALLENGYRVIVYDRRGFGKSTKSLRGHDYNTLASDLNDLITKLDLHNAAIVGFSMGGGEVVRYLSRYGSARVTRAALISSVAPYMLKTADNPDGTPEETFDGFKQALLKDRFDFLQTFGQGFYGRSAVHHTVSQAVLDWTFSLATQASLQATLGDLEAFSKTDFRAEMKTLEIRFLVIHGTGDKTVPIDAAGRAAAKLLPNCSYLEYDGEPHGLFMTAPVKLNADLINFLGGDHNTAPKLAQI